MSDLQKYRAVTITMIALAVVFVFLRLLSRWTGGRKWGAKVELDDFVILASLVFLFAEAGLNLTLGYYLDSDSVLASRLAVIGKLSIAFDCAYCVTVWMVKTSILLLYIRVFPTREIRRAAIILGIIVISWALATICVSIFRCSPVSSAWDISTSGKCIDMKAFSIGTAVPNIATNIAILLLPMRAVWELGTTSAHRISVNIIFLFGSFVVLISGYQFATSMNLETTNISWKLGKYCTWRVVECSSGIISACLPALRHFFTTISSKFADQMGPQKIRTANRHVSEVTQPSNLTFRPKNELLTKPRVHLTVKQIEDESGDEVPLNIIMVRHSMTWQETNCEPAQNWR